MFNNAVAINVGAVTHRLIGAAVTEGLGPDDLDQLARLTWSIDPQASTLSWQYRHQVTSMAAVYLRRLRPVGWQLLGTEVALGQTVADLVYGRFAGDDLVDVFVDEIKTGRRATGTPELVDQVRRLHDGATTRWPESFRGVRVAEPLRASAAGFWAADRAQLVPVPAPAAFECGESVR